METASEHPPELLHDTSDEESADTLIAKRPAPIVLPHAGYVHLDRACNGVWQVSHMVTQETKNLPEGDWSVVFDEDGYGCAIDISKDDGTPIFFDELLHAQLCEDFAGRLVIVQGLGYRATAHFLLDRERRYCEGTTSVPYGISHAASLDFMFVEHKREGCRILWKLQDLYPLLGLHTYSGQSSKWVWTSMATWTSFWERFGYMDPVVRSPQGETVAAAVDSRTHFAPWSACTTPALISLLARFTSTTTQAGGLSSADQRSEARSLLTGLLATGTGTKSLLPVRWTIPIRFSTCLVASWPRPETLEADIHLVVCANGEIDLREWASLVQAADKRSLMSQWFVNVFSGRFSTISLTELVVRVCRYRKGVSLASQVLWHVATYIDAKVATTARDYSKRPAKKQGVFHATFVNEADRAFAPREVNLALSRFLNGCRTACENQQYFAVNTDKAEVKGLRLSNGGLVLNDNVAFPLPPQVATYSGHKDNTTIFRQKNTSWWIDFRYKTTEFLSTKIQKIRFSKSPKPV
jgi:hypothetical protein